jgi:hypothetical protein
MLMQPPFDLGVISLFFGATLVDARIMNIVLSNVCLALPLHDPQRPMTHS